MNVCRLFHFIKNGIECAERFKLKYVQDIGRLECYRTGFCDCLKFFEQKGYDVKVKEIDKDIDMIVIEKKICMDSDEFKLSKNP